MRAAVRLTQIMALDQGFIAERRRFEEDALLDAVSAMAPAALAISASQARLIVKTLIFCAVRYATTPPAELRRLAGCAPETTDDETQTLVEDHLVAVMRAFLSTAR
jgi:hypothetical protein